MPRIARRMTVLIVALLGGYVALNVIVWLAQDFLTFPGAGRDGDVTGIVPDGVRVERLDVPWVGDVRIAVAEPAGADRVVIGFGGNGENLRSGLYWVELFRDYGAAAIYVEHPGYGDSDGEPGVAAFHAAAAAAGAKARALAAGRPVIAFGSSIGDTKFPQ